VNAAFLDASETTRLADHAGWSDFVDTSFRADHIGIARVDRQGVRPCCLSLRGPSHLELSHRAFTFLMGFSADITC
jgi:hypothetical protein